MPSPGSLRQANLTLSNLLIPVAVLVFATGFFPYKPVLPGLATWEDLGREEPVTAEGNGLGRGTQDGGAPFDRVVFMVVDALRSDFVYGHSSGMEFTQSLVRSGAAVPFTAHATPPTVTMPRVKALTTGSVPSFLDLILNFAESDTSSSLAGQDTWLAQLRSRIPHGSTHNTAPSPSNLVFYGDDTWLKLFPPPFFARSDGTSSFFVSDFTEVDHNVTRHLPRELAQDDWSALIMHFLGLDHIGHKTGPQGPNMLPKQREMDGIVQMIYEAMEEREHLGNTLLVLAGDHGMNAGGNHGGSGPGETEPALVFASPKLKSMRKLRTYDCPTAPKEGTEFHYYTKVEQSDLVPTLAGLMGFPVPKNSLGVFIPELAGALGEDEQSVQILRRNAKQVAGILEATHGEKEFRDGLAYWQKVAAGGWDETCGKTEENCATDLTCPLGTAYALKDLDGEADKLREFLARAQEEMSSTASSYDIPRMVAGMVVAAVALVLAVCSFPSFWPPSLAGTFLAFTTLLYGIMMFASSYVEEEQHFWYWLTPAWLALLALLEFRRGARLLILGRLLVPRAALTIPLLALHRLMLRWNQTGQKHAGAADIVHAFFPRYHIMMWLLVLGTYAYVGIKIARFSFKDIMTREAAISTAAVMIIPSVVFKLNFTQADAPELVLGLAEKVRTFTQDLDLVVQARIVFAVLSIAAGSVAVGAPIIARLKAGQGKMDEVPPPTLPKRLQPLLTLFLITQTRAPNIPLFLTLELQRQLIAALLTPATSPTRSAKAPAESLNILSLAITTLLFSKTTYFAFGGSNSISSIDLSNAYNGVSDYNVVAVGILLFASNWAGAVWWLGAAVTLLSGDRGSGSGVGGASQGNGKVGGGSRAWIEKERARLMADTHTTVGSESKGTATSAVEIGAQETRAWSTYIAAMTVFVAGSLVAVMAACTALRTHLFIWTVFSPKYLYATAWAVGWHLVINVCLGGLLWSVRGVA